MLNKIELISISVASITIYCGVYSSIEDLNEDTKFLMFLIITTTNGLFMLAWGFEFSISIIYVITERFPWMKK